MTRKHITWPRLIMAALGLGMVLAMIQPDCYLTYDDRDLTWPAIWPRICFYVPVCLVVLSLLLFPLKIIRWLFTWRTIKWLLRGLVVLLVPVTLFYAEEDWRGKTAWEKYRQAEEAKGEKYDFASFIPPPVPDEQNFALTPIVASCYSRYLDKNGKRLRPENTNVINRLDMHSGDLEFWSAGDTNPMGCWQLVQHIDFRPWQQFYRTNIDTNCFPTGTNTYPIAARPQAPVVDVLLALSKYDSALEELRQAAEKCPESRFPINYEDVSPPAFYQPHLPAFEQCTEVLELRSLAELANHENGKALEDVKLMARLSDSICREPFYYSQLFRLTFLSKLIQPIWEGTADRQWSPEQLADLQERLGKFNLPPECLFIVRSERAMNLNRIEFMLSHRSEAWQFMPKSYSLGQEPDYWRPDYDNNNPAPLTFKLVSSLVPSGRFYSEELAISRVYQTRVSATTTNAGDLISVHDTAELSMKNVYNGRSSWNELSRIECTYPFELVRRFVEVQSYLNLAQLGCALERYSLAHDKYPENLEMLAPQFIESVPRDIINGQPLHYHRTPDGRFQLYSTGWSGKDNGGIPGRYDSGEFDFRKGDLVWQYPAPALSSVSRPSTK